MYNYKCKGTCSTSIDLEIQDGVITYCKINSGRRHHLLQNQQRLPR